MNQEKESRQSPFSALTYQEQQDRWLEWRSRQLDYQPVEKMQEQNNGAGKDLRQEHDNWEPVKEAAVQWPMLRNPAPTRHGELDKLRSRHAQAARRAGSYQAASISGISPGKMPSPDPNGG